MNAETLTNKLLKEYLSVIETNDLTAMKLFLGEQGWIDYYDENDPVKLVKGYKHCCHRYIQDILSEVQWQVHQLLFK